MQAHHLRRAHRSLLCLGWASLCSLVVTGFARLGNVVSGGPWRIGSRWLTSTPSELRVDVDIGPTYITV